MYGIIYVKDTDLPDKQEWVVTETREGDVFVLMKHSAVRPRSLADAWAAVRRLGGSTVPPQPTRLSTV